MPTDLDKPYLITLITRRSAPFEILYPDPDELLFQVYQWSGYRKPIWEHLLETTEYEYNPIHNYDIEDTWTETGEGTNSKDTTTSGTGSTTKGSTTNASGEQNVDTTGDTTTSKSETVNTSRSAYDGIGQTMPMRLVETVSTTGSGTEHSTGSSDLDYEDTTTVSETGSSTNSGTQNEEGEYTNTLEHTQRKAGNIGVMATQDLILKEREIAMFSVYDVIANEFIHEFCLTVY